MMNLWLILAITELGLLTVVGQIAALFFWHVLRERPSSQTEPPSLATHQTPDNGRAGQALSGQAAHAW
jgi:hypothetical protein